MNDTDAVHAALHHNPDTRGPLPHDLVIVGGRLLDPETSFDAIGNIAINGDRIVAVTTQDVIGRRTVDATGLVVAPGFIDLHSHAQTLAGHRLQALDGVTTALELEVGATPVARVRSVAENEGRPLNYGWSASWAMARMHVLTGIALLGSPFDALDALGDERWQGAASATEVSRILGFVEQELSQGALGIGVPLGYAQGSDPQEYLDLADLAARSGVPVFTHARDLIEVRPDVSIDGAHEIVRAAAASGAAMHYCHVNSTSTRHVDRVIDLIDAARREGSRVTTEAYPYGAGLTSISAEFLAPDRLALLNLEPSDLHLLEAGERVADVSHLEWLRRHEAHQLVIVPFIDEEQALAPGGILQRAFAYEHTVVASDALAPIDMAGHPGSDELWPLPATMTAHPRVSGTFSRSLRLLVDQLGLPWLDAVSRCTLEPARILETSCQAMARKGRLQAGADADIVVFDSSGIRDQATYATPLAPNVGVRHVIVNGQFVVHDGALKPEARPGRAISSV